MAKEPTPDTTILTFPVERAKLRIAKPAEQMPAVEDAEQESAAPTASLRQIAKEMVFRTGTPSLTHILESAAAEKLYKKYQVTKEEMLFASFPKILPVEDDIAKAQMARVQQLVQSTPKLHQLMELVQTGYMIDAQYVERTTRLMQKPGSEARKEKLRDATNQFESFYRAELGLGDHQTFETMRELHHQVKLRLRTRLPSVGAER